MNFYNQKTNERNQSMKAKVAVINFSGNVGKTTIAKQLLAPRMDAPEFTIETINAGASDHQGVSERLSGSEFGVLYEALLSISCAIVDVGASNIEEFVTLMGQFHRSHQLFDFYVIPTVSETKQQEDTVNTIAALAAMGVPEKKIRVVFNKVPLRDAAKIDRLFPMLFGLHEEKKGFTLHRGATIFNNDAFEQLRELKMSIKDVLTDNTDYITLSREGKDEATKAHAVAMCHAQALAFTANRNMDDVFKVLFK
jgi:hypothetical protein